VKIKLSVGESPYNGYLNIDPCPKIEQDKVGTYNLLIAAPREIPVENAVVDEILCNSIEYLTRLNFAGYVEHWASKLRHRGTITITGTDLEKTLLDYHNGVINIAELNTILYGNHEHPWDAKSLHLSQADISSVLLSAGLKIKRKMFEGNKYIITAERP